MAMRTAQLLVPAVLLLVQLLVLWPSSLHARSMPGDLDTAEYVPTTESGGYEDPAPDSSFDETFTTQEALHIPELSTFDSYESNSLAEPTVSEAAPVDEEAVFMDSPETVSTSSFAENSEVQPTDEVVYSDAQYENDEVYFDTSSADTVYRANDDGLNLGSDGSDQHDGP